MRITFIGHASILVEAKGKTILSDPWWTGPCFGAQWWVYPAPAAHLVDSRPIDFIYISHGHHDHLHPGTLARFSRDAVVLVSAKHDIAETIRRLGFTVREIQPGEVAEIAPGLKVRIEPVAGDSFMTVDDGTEVLANFNDALHPLPEPVQAQYIDWVRARHPHVDYLFCGYGTASHFPNCYQIPGKDMAASAIRRQHYFNESWARLVDALRPTMAIPFAADLVFLERELMWSNAPVHNAERPTDLYRRMFPNSPVQLADPAPGFAVDKCAVVDARLATPLNDSRLLAEMERQVEQANRYPVTTRPQVEAVCEALRGNIERRLEHLAGFPGSYRFQIELRNSDAHLEITKSSRRVEAAVVTSLEAPASVRMVTRANYLKNCLAEKYGWEVLFVGSGCQIVYSDQETAFTDLHRELLSAIICADRPQEPRWGGQNRLVYEAKQIAKRMLGREERSLYDLRHWTVLHGPTVSLIELGRALEGANRESGKDAPQTPVSGHSRR